MNKDDLIKTLFLSSVQLIESDDEGNPSNAASGALIDYCGCRMLLTVAHATVNQKKLAIQLGYSPNSGTALYHLGEMHFLEKVNINTNKKELIDLSYVPVPNNLQATRQQIGECNLEVIWTEPINIHEPKFTEQPTAEESYGFCGMVKPLLEPHPNVTIFSGDINVYHGLKYLHEKDGLYYFKLPFKHPGHKNFKGCSGAPVLDTKSNVVGLVLGGCEKKNEIRVIPLRRYKIVFDILVGNI